MLYLFEDIDKLHDDFPKRCMPYLSEQRCDKVFSYRFALDRKLSAAVYLLLRLALKENYGIDKPVNFSYGKNGKPFLRDYPQIHFSLSHCKCAAVCAVSPGEIGVDVQEVTAVSDDLVKRILTVEEYAAFLSAAHPCRKFCEYWVMKESYLKKTGDGIGTDLTSLSSDNIGEKTLFKSGEEYCGCVTGVYSELRRMDTAKLADPSVFQNKYELFIS